MTATSTSSLLGPVGGTPPGSGGNALLAECTRSARARPFPSRESVVDAGQSAVTNTAGACGRLVGANPPPANQRGAVGEPPENARKGRAAIVGSMPGLTAQIAQSRRGRVRPWATGLGNVVGAGPIGIAAQRRSWWATLSPFSGTVPDARTTATASYPVRLRWATRRGRLRHGNRCRGLPRATAVP